MESIVRKFNLQSRKTKCKIYTTANTKFLIQNMKKSTAMFIYLRWECEIKLFSYVTTMTSISTCMIHNVYTVLKNDKYVKSNNINLSKQMLNVNKKICNILAWNFCFDSSKGREWMERLQTAIFTVFRQHWNFSGRAHSGRVH